MESLWSGSIGSWTEPPAAPSGRGHRRRRARRGSESSDAVEPRSGQPDVPLAPPSEIDLRTCDPTTDDGPAPPRPSGERAPLPVEIIRSSKRRKTLAARIVDGRIVVRVPAGLSAAQERESVASLVARLERQREAEHVDLHARAEALAHRYGLPVPASIRFVSNQSQRWGSCTPSTAEIRISDRIAGFPGWVLDAVVVHELAHLVHLHHTPEFWAMANRYPKTERAYGFLLAMQMADEGLAPPPS